MLPRPYMAGFRAGLALLACTIAAFGCSDPSPTNGGGGGQTIADYACLSGSTQIDCKATPEVINTTSGKKVGSGQTDTLAVGSVAKQKSLGFTYRISNVASAVSAAGLVIDDIKLEYTPLPGEETAGDPAFRCLATDGQACGAKTGQWKKLVPAGVTPTAGQGMTEQFTILFKRFDDKERSAKVTLSLRGVASNQATYSFVVKTKLGSPSAKFQSTDQSDPANGVNLPAVQPGQTVTRVIKLLNTGEADLSVTGFDLTTLDNTFTFKLTNPADVDVGSHAGGEIWTLPSVLSVPSQGSATLEMTFKPTDDKMRKGLVSIKTTSNDPNAADLLVQANSQMPCILVTPGEYNFNGAVPGYEPGELKAVISNCGAIELELTSVAFNAALGNSTEFSIDVSDLVKNGKLAANEPISPSNMLKIPVGGNAQIRITYSPADVTPDNADPDKAVIEFKSNAYVVPQLVVKGTGIKVTCPLPKINVVEGEEVVPQTLLHLSGLKSIAPGGGSIAKYQWTVKQPLGSAQPLNPNATVATPTLLANTAGEYEFCLDVWDNMGTKSCTPTCTKVLVVPNNAIHVELLWDTPADSDQGDTGPAAGADLDLHFAHPLASEQDLDCDTTPDPWFNNPWDTFWFNNKPPWGSSSSSEDDPGLDLDDTDGAGPENLNLAKPEGSVDDPQYYSVGVHYWNDHGYGPSYATVAIYVQGAQVLQFTKIKMNPLDMWYVGKLWWPNLASGGNKKVFEACYQSGQSCAAKQNLMWQPKGDWCITPCYVNKAFVGTVTGGATSPTCK
ncbi:MAG: hypothetical protein HY902_00335 [Deltaproteobacteria bacterium]|nr:hypothetical protein [Deltaproteobacteria bacterium]